MVDVLQIPAFLCRQTDLLLAAAPHRRPVNIKKGQFLAPWDLRMSLRRCAAAPATPNVWSPSGAPASATTTWCRIFAASRSCAQTGCPVIFDATHSVQQPGGQGEASGGQREFVPVLARAAVAVGVAGLFIETHDQPDQAFSDGPNMVPLEQMERLLAHLIAFDRIAKAGRDHAGRPTL